MQSIINFVSYLGIAIVLLLISELMLRRLIRGLESASDSFFEKSKSTVSFTLFNHSQFIWKMIFISLWILSGIITLVTITESPDSEIIAVFVIWFYLMGELRFDRSNKYVQQMYSRIKWTANWQEYELYRLLLETENQNFIKIINDPEKLKQLETTSRHTRNAIMFDPKKMRWLKTRDEIESRLIHNIKFLMSKERSVSHSLEEVYVILFMLSEKDDTLTGMIEDFLARQDWQQLVTEK